MTVNDSGQRSRLLALKLRALLRAQPGEDADAYATAEFPLGAALVSPARTWILVEGGATSCLGPVLAWSRRHDGPVELVVEAAPGPVARRARGFDLPVTVWTVESDRLVRAEPAPHGTVRPAPAFDPSPFIDDMVAGGVDPVLEDGILRGEVRGLEVCRVVVDESGPRLEVGIGAHDREAFAMVHAATPVRDALSNVAAAVLAHRVVGAPHHPYNALAPERFARWRVMERPGLIGWSTAAAVDPAVARVNVMDISPCALLGTGDDGAPSVAVFVHGIDLDAVPTAVDLALREGTASATVVCRAIDVVDSMRHMARAARPRIGFASLEP